MNTSPSFSEKLFGFTDLLRARMRNKGHEQEIGDPTSKLVQLAAFGKNEWSYFGMVRQLRIERKIDKKALDQGSEYIRKFTITIRTWQKSEAAKGLSQKELLKFQERAKELTELLDNALANEWGSQALSAIDLCNTFLETFDIDLQAAPEDYKYELKGKKQSVTIQVNGDNGQSETIDPDYLYHYELVRPKGNAPKTFVMLYDLFKHSEQRRYTETNQGERARYKLYRAFLFIGWVLFTAATELLTITQFRPGVTATNYFLIPAGISLLWIFVIYFLVRMIIGTTWVFYSFLVEIPSKSGRGGPQALLLVNSKSLNHFETVSKLLKTNTDFIRALGETMMSFQEATFARLKVSNKALSLKVGALEEKIKKQEILDETGSRLNGKTRVIYKRPWYGPVALGAFVILAVFDIILAAAGGL